MTTYLGALSRGLRTITIRRDGKPISDELIERCARAAYEAVMADAPPSRATWDERPEPFREQDRIQARAVLTEALRPPPDQDQRQPIDGQEALL